MILLADEWRDATTTMQELIYARQLAVLVVGVLLILFQITVLVMQVYKVRLHRRTAQRINLTFTKMDTVLEGNVSVLKAYKAMAVSHEMAANRTLGDVRDIVAQGVTTAAAVVAKADAVAAAESVLSEK